MDVVEERKRKQKLYEAMILQLNEIFPNHSLQAIMDAVKKAKLNLELAMQYVLETPLVEQPPIPAPVAPATAVTAPQIVTRVSNSDAQSEDESSGEETKKKKKASTSALKRKIPRVQEMIPDASDEVVLHCLQRVNGDVDKCILLLLEDPDAGTRVPPSTGQEPLPSDDEASDSDSASDDEIDSAGSFDPNDLADWDDQMMSEIDGWFVTPEQEPTRVRDQGPNLLHQLYQELADEEIARAMQAEWREHVAAPRPQINYVHRVRAAPVPVSVSVSVEPEKRNQDYDSAALATFMKRVNSTVPVATEEPTRVRAAKRAPQLRQLIHMLRREKELAVIRHKMASTMLLVTDDQVKAEEARLKSEKALASDVAVEDDTSPVPDASSVEETDALPQSFRHYLALQREELASLQVLFAEGKLKQSTSLPFILSAVLQDPKDELGAQLFQRPLHLNLVLVFGPAYPARLPRLLLRTNSLESQLRESTLQRLKHVLTQTARELRGMPMVARLMEVAQEFLQTAPSVRYDAALSHSDDREDVNRDYADSLRHILTQKQTYSVLDSHDILNYRSLTLQRATERLTEFGAVPGPAVLRILLTHCQWDLNKLVAVYREAAINNRLALLYAEAGVANGASGDEDDKYFEQTMECPGCLEEYSLDHMIGLQCRHFYCADCYNNYMTLKINEGASDDITCPAFKCKYIIDPVLLASLADTALYNKYVRFVTKSFVDRNPNIKWCPAAGCNFAVLSPGHERMIFCKCGSVWCFQCMGDGHWPSTCNELKWFRQSHGKRDAGEDKEMKTLQWLLSFTKDCPKCGNPIEKNGGCNHMSCSACKYQFCWICLSGWASSHYTCKSRASKDERENLLQHFENNMSFFSMYMMHETERTAKDVRLKAAVASKMKHVARQPNSNIDDCEALANAVQYIYLCRHVIMNICVVGDYAVSHSIGGTQFFRGDLRRIVTDMSLLRAMIEGKSSKLSIETVVNCSAALKISLRDFTVKFGGWRQRVKQKQEQRMERVMAQFPEQ